MHELFAFYKQSFAWTASSHARHLLLLCDSVRNVRSSLVQVEIKTSKDTPDIGNLQRAADFIHAFLLGAH